MSKKKIPLNIRKLLVLILILIVVVVSVFLLIRYLFQKEIPLAPMMPSEEIALQLDAVEFTSKLLFPKSKDEIEFYFNNPDSNTVSMMLQIIKLDTDEILYETKLIEPGNQVSTIKLNKKLEPGKYICGGQIVAYDNTTKEETIVGTKTRQTIIVVQK